LGIERTGGSVHACANSRGTLRLLEHGDCPRHYSKVTINERGPRGPRGERGRRGLPGTPGPGAVSLVVNSATAPSCNPTCWVGSGAIGDTPVTTHLGSAPTLLSTRQVGDPHSVEFTAPNGSLVADVLVTQDDRVFSVQLGEFRDGGNCWAHALVTPAG